LPIRFVLSVFTAGNFCLTAQAVQIAQAGNFAKIGAIRFPQKDRFMTPEQQFDIASYAARSNPFPLYQEMFAAGDVHWNEATQGWYIMRYADVTAALRDPRFSASRLRPIYNRLPPALQEKYALLFRSLGLWALLLDPPEHTQIRKLIMEAFQPRLIYALRPKVEEVIAELLSPVLAAGQIQVIRDLAYPLPAIIIAEMLGVPKSDQDRLKRWSDVIAGFFGAQQMTPEVIERTQNAIAELNGYFGAIVAARRQRPADALPDDIMNSLLQAEVEGERLTDEQILATCGMLIFGGHETTTYLIANGMLAFATHPDQRALLLEKPALLENAVEECLRYDAPVQRTTRASTAEVEIGGVTIPAGQRIYIMLGAANRDPLHYESPDTFDITRANIKHASFGYGLHFCVGATLGRLEAQVAIQTMLTRMPNLRLVAVSEYKDNHAFHAPEEVTLAFDPT
jgi:cytochrome P450